MPARSRLLLFGLIEMATGIAVAGGAVWHFNTHPFRPKVGHLDNERTCQTHRLRSWP